MNEKIETFSQMFDSGPKTYIMQLFCTVIENCRGILPPPPQHSIALGYRVNNRWNMHVQSLGFPVLLSSDRIGFFCKEWLVSMARIRNVFEIIELYGHDENFVPHVSEEFTPTTAPAGSRQKIDVLAERIQRGMPLWHPEDSTDSTDLVTAGNTA